MIYVTADTHGEIDRFKEKDIRRLGRKDTLIVLGDFGFLWDGSKQEQKNLHWLTKRRYKILFLDGCHDNYDMLKEYPAEAFMGGKARHIGGSVYYICRGSVLEIEDKKLLCFGGGESFDKEDRVEGVNWWRAEMPTSDELEWCIDNLKACENQVDYILTHDAPRKLLDFTNIRSEDFQGNWLHAFFDKLIDHVQYRCWYFGRYHRDQAISTKARAVFCHVIPLE